MKNLTNDELKQIANAGNNYKSWLAENGYQQWLVDNGYIFWLAIHGYKQCLTKNGYQEDKITDNDIKELLK